MRKRVYISGPISGSGDIITNVCDGLAVARILITLGFSPFCPHLSHFLDRDRKIAHNVWLECDLSWVEVSDAILRLPGASPGADEEVEFAKKNNIPVFTDIDDLLLYLMEE